MTRARPGAATLLLRGPVFTGEGWTDALAIAGEQVLALGADALERRGPDTRELRVEGCAVPGFHDAHTHLLGGALASEAPDLGAATDSRHLAEIVRAWVVEHDLPPEAWVYGRGWESDRFPDGAWPSRADLDAVAPERPVLLRRRDGHAAIANGAALRRAGISASSADPPGGRILKGPDGEPTGVLLEDPALELVTELIPAPDTATKERALARVMREAAALGITSLQDDTSYDERLRGGPLYASLYEQGLLLARVSVWRKLGRPFEELREEELALAARVPREHVAYGPLKGYLDGSLGSRTAHMHADYSDEAGNRGVDLDEAGHLAARVRAAHAAGYQIALHAIGDLALTRALDLIEGAGPREEVLARRHRVEHAQCFQPEDIARLAQVGAVASVQPIHLASDLLIAPARLGAERCRDAYPWAALRDVGALLAFGTDYPIEPLDPFAGIYTALTRKAPPPRPEATLAPFHAEQALTLEECLNAYAAGAARAAHLEESRGRLVPGQLADVAILSHDLRTDPQALLDARCQVTLRGGQVVFEC